MQYKVARAIAGLVDREPERYLSIDLVQVVEVEPGRWGVVTYTEHGQWTDTDEREARETLRQLR